MKILKVRLYVQLFTYLIISFGMHFFIYIGMFNVFSVMNISTIHQSSQFLLRINYEIFEKQLTVLNKKKTHSGAVHQTDNKIHSENIEINNISSQVSNYTKSSLIEKKYSNDFIVNKKNVIFNNPIYRVNPLYPDQAKLLKIKGKVTVLYDINIIGKVENIRILYSSPPKIFDDNVLSAMMCWIYERNKPKNGLILTFKFDFHGVKKRF